MEKLKDLKQAAEVATAKPEEVKKWIKNDLYAAISLLTMIVNDPVILDKVSDAVIESAYQAKSGIDAIEKRMKEKELEKQENA